MKSDKRRYRPSPHARTCRRRRAPAAAGDTATILEFHSPSRLHPWRPWPLLSPLPIAAKWDQPLPFRLKSRTGRPSASATTARSASAVATHDRRSPVGGEAEAPPRVSHRSRAPRAGVPRRPASLCAPGIRLPTVAEVDRGGRDYELTSSRPAGSPRHCRLQRRTNATRPHCAPPLKPSCACEGAGAGSEIASESRRQQAKSIAS